MGNEDLNSLYCNYIINSATNSSTITNTYSTNSTYDLYSTGFDLCSALYVLTEDEIMAFVYPCSLRMDKENFKTLIKYVVRFQHFSEKFLIQYLDYLDKETIMAQHKREIISGEYSTVSLYLNVT